MRTKAFSKYNDPFDESTRFRDTSQQIHKQWQTDPARAFPTIGNTNINSSLVLVRDGTAFESTPNPSSSPSDEFQVTYNGNYDHTRNIEHFNSALYEKTKVQKTPSMSSKSPSIRVDSPSIMLTGKGGRVSEVMELSYVTERIIALWYREDTQGVLEHATNLLRGKHANNYMIFNLSSIKIRKPNTRECGWPQGLSPSLEKLCALCKELDSWLNAAPNHVVVLHSIDFKERIGVCVSTYLNYSCICGGQDQALDTFAMQKFLDDKIGSIRVPSHRRYIEYFTGLLSGSLRINPSPLYLTHITVLGVPLFEPIGCRAFLKIYEGLTPIYTSDLYSVTNAREFTVNLGSLRLRGDILIKCYHRIYSKQSREVMFSLQFHTCVITENVISFPRSELDVACDDRRCPADSVVTLYFSSDAKRQDGPVPAPTPAVPHASAHHDPILHWDSYLNLDTSDDEGRETSLSSPPLSSSSIQLSPRSLGYTCGPIDGSLYAVVHQGTSGAARGSPLTVSMDSGISSAPPQRPSPPEIELSESQVHGDLDKLLYDMMMTVESMPDPTNLNECNRANNRVQKLYVHNGVSYDSSNSTSNYSTLRDSSHRSYSNSARDYLHGPSTNNYETMKSESKNSFTESKKTLTPKATISFMDEDIPYHARQTSQPFSYGATTDMIKHQKLSSPSLVRKATMKGSAPIAHFDDILGEYSRSVSPLSPNTPDPPPEFANGFQKSNSDSTDGVSWLRQQQLKLAARRDEKSPGKLWRQETSNRVIGELRSLQRSRLRQDGYASDSAVLDNDDEMSMHSPIHSQTMRLAPHTSAPASPLLRQRSKTRKSNDIIMNGTHGRPRAESVNERPFTSIKRSYETQTFTDGQHNESSSSWLDRSISPGSAAIGTASRPQTPAFPVYPRTPYVNNSSSTVTFASDRNYMASSNINNAYNYSVQNNNIHELDHGSHNNNNIDREYTNGHVFVEERRHVSSEMGLPPKSPPAQRKEYLIQPTSETILTSSVNHNVNTPTHVEFLQSPKSTTSFFSMSSSGHSSPQVPFYGTRRSSIHSNTEPQEVSDINVKFVRDTSKIWYKPNISREQAIAMLKDAAPGTFVVRDSNSFPGAFGLALKVATPPPGAPSSPKDPSSELVRHFLIEPTSKGVRLKGCANEPVFSSLSALVYQHSLMTMALPCQLLLPEPEAAAKVLDSPNTSSTQQLLAQGAACNVLYLFTMDTESLTGPQAIRKTISTLFKQNPLPTATIVHFKVSTQGITLTDNARKLFFRRHYPTTNISYCGLDTDERTWNYSSNDNEKHSSAHRCFGFVARKPAHKSDNQCHVFAELEPGQPATAIVNFVNKVIMESSTTKANIV
ncbi:tensin-3 isoform X2 [Chelonus insularis]|uniref:tensin-3 isoform X2 n=1 Tax=Chelonus insularis TaxID=460826 RepID=UPI0015894F27|nr:tensin-3 isoform X2 [Chelonus insularis]